MIEFVAVDPDGAWELWYIAVGVASRYMVSVSKGEISLVWFTQNLGRKDEATYRRDLTDDLKRDFLAFRAENLERLDAARLAAKKSLKMKRKR